MALLSPGVEIKEIDASTIVPTVSDSTGVFCGEFVKGPINEKILITNPDDLIEIFGKPNEDTYNQFFQAWNFLQYQNTLYVTRANAGQKTSLVGVTGSDVILNQEDFEKKQKSGLTVSGDLGFFAQTPGVWGDEIEIEIVLPEDFNSPLRKVVFGGVPVENYFEYYPEVGTQEFGVIIKNGDEIESFLVSSNKDSKDSNGRSNFVETVINRSSKLAYVVYNSAPVSTANSSVTAITFTGNEDDKDHVVTGPNGETSTVTGPVANGAVYEWTAIFDELLEAGETVTITAKTEQDADINDTETVPPLVLKPNKQLTGGDDGQGTPDLIEAYELYSNVEEIDVDIIIGNEEDDGRSQINLASSRKDCIAFYGSPEAVSTGKKSGEAVQSIDAWRKGSSFNHNTMFACVQGNYKYQYDRYNDKNRWINLQGDIQGLRAQTNTTNASWWASAGLDRGQIKNVLKLAFIPNQPQRDLLYKSGINPVTSFPGLGTVMWGQKTLLAKPSSFDRVNVRGLFNIVERSLAKMSRFQVFEFNDEFTRNRIVQMIRPFLETVQAGRGIQDFLVVCDTSNNTPDVISRNQLIVDVYIKPTYQAEFITLRFTNAGVNDFSTIVA